MSPTPPQPVTESTARGPVVLVGVDGSEGSRAALAWAAWFAGSIGGRLRAVGAWSHPALAVLPGGPVPEDAATMATRTREVIEEAVTEMVAPEVAASIEIAVEAGSASRALLSWTRPDTALVVVGKRGLGAVEGRLLGSVSRRIAELSTVPVAVIPHEWRPSASQGPLVVGVDGSPSAAAATTWAIDAAQAIGCGVRVVHGVAGLPAEMPPSAIDRFMARAVEMADGHAGVVRAAGVDASISVESVDPRLLLRQVADDVDARMIVVGAQGEGPAAGLLIGSVVSHVAQQSSRPVVVVNRPA